MTVHYVPAKRPATPDILGAVLTAKPLMLDIDQINRNGGTQPRAGLNDNQVREYARLLEEGVDLGPVDVMFDGETYWLWDGFHRMAAHDTLGLLTIAVNVHQGTQSDAQWASYAANKTHGLNRSNADKERAIQAALRHPNGVATSDRELAKHIGVDGKTIGKYRSMLQSSAEIPQIEERTVTRGGQSYTQNTTNIGAKPAPAPAPAQPKTYPYQRQTWFPIGWDADDTAEYNRILPLCDEHGIPDATLIRRELVARRFAAEAGRDGDGAKKEAVWNLFYRLRDGEKVVSPPSEKPAYDNTPVYRTVAELEAEVRSFVPVFYSEPGELLRAPKDMRACVQVMGGGFWNMICKQTASFMNRDMARAILNVALELEEAQQATPVVNTAPATPDTEAIDVVLPPNNISGPYNLTPVVTLDELETVAIADVPKQVNQIPMAQVRQWIWSGFSYNAPMVKEWAPGRLNRMLTDDEDGAWGKFDLVFGGRYGYDAAAVKIAIGIVLGEIEAGAVFTADTVLGDLGPVVDDTIYDDEEPDEPDILPKNIAKRINQLWNCKREMTDLVEDTLPRFSGLTGHYVDVVLSVTRGLTKLIDVLETELKSLDPKENNHG